MATIDDIAALLKSAGLDPRQANGVLEAFRIALTGSSSLTVKEGGTTVSSSITTLDFGAGFDLTESPAGEVNVALDLSEVTVNISDGDKGDITVSGGGTTWTLDLDLSTITVPSGPVDFDQQEATHFRIENRTSDPGTPAVGEIWLRTDL